MGVTYGGRGSALDPIQRACIAIGALLLAVLALIGPEPATDTPATNHQETHQP